MGFDLGDAIKLGKKLTKKGAPLIGTLIGGQVGGAAGEIISSLFGGEKDPNKISKMLDKDPELYARLIEYEMNHKVELEKLHIEGKRLEVENMASARNREVSVIQRTGKKDKLMDMLSIGIVCGFFANTIAIIALMATGQLKGLDESLVLLLGSLEGTLAAGFMAVINYYYGSSKGSTDKNDIFKGVN